MTQYVEVKFSATDNMQQRCSEYVNLLAAEHPVIAICVGNSSYTFDGYEVSNLQVIDFAASLRGRTMDAIVVITNKVVSEGDKEAMKATLAANDGVLAVLSHD